MGFWDTITDLVEAAAPWATADADAPAKELV
jgi:ubiquinol-cytochrome c reductase subunit 6